MTAEPIRPPVVLGLHSRLTDDGVSRSYVRFAAVGDSFTAGIGDPHGDGYRGWARILAGAMQKDHDVSFTNLARPGSLVADVRGEQLKAALDHRPHVASLIVGLNDTMRAAFDPAQLRKDLLHCAARFAEQGTLLMTVRFHDHSRLFHLPRPLARPLRSRIAVLNEVYDEIHQRHHGVRLDLSTHPGVYDREFWSIDRLHPSELGHRAVADEFAALLDERGLSFDGPGFDLDGLDATRWDELRWLRAEVLPWIGRRVKDLGPHVASNAISTAKRRWVPLGSMCAPPGEPGP